MADSDRVSRSIRVGPDEIEVQVVEVERPIWGTIVFRSVDDPDRLFVEQLISVGPYKVDVQHLRQLDEQQVAAYVGGRLDFVALAEAAGVELNRSNTVEPPTAAHVGPTSRRWVDDQISAAQSLAALLVESASGAMTRFGNHQNDAEFGLTVTAPAEPLARAVSGGYRVRALGELPAGLVTSVATRTSDAGDLTEIDVGVDDEVIRIVAGEIHETETERLEFHRFDESLLVFRSHDEYDSIEWTPPL